MTSPPSTAASLWIASVCCVLTSAVAAGEAAAGRAAVEPHGIALLPKAFKLTGASARQRLIVQRARGAHLEEQLTDGITFETSDASVVKVIDGVAVPVGIGTAELIARVDGRITRAEVTVELFDRPAEWSFRNLVEPVMTKSGCNSGACHGAAAGKNGFKLSLRGYDPEGDFRQMTRQAGGRRIVPTDPARSLVLLKPTGALPHKGGVRFATDSPEYRAIAGWIAAGTPAPAPNDTRITRLEVLPGSVTLRPGAVQQLVVRAHFDDGHAEDVTRWAKYDVTVTTTASVDADGLVTVVGYGECAVTVWYHSRIAIATITVPYGEEGDPQVFARAPRRNFIDDHVVAKLEALNIPPSPPASDAEFLRRAWLDTVGVLPGAAAARAFLADTRADKRDRLIESLLERPEFVDYWAYKWSDVLLVNSARLSPESMWAFYRWIRNQVEANTPWDRFARELVTATGSTLENGATNFFVLHQDPRKLAETTSLTFLGLSIECAKCHNHPLEKWTNDQYYGMANLFARVRSKALPGESPVVYSAVSGELLQPLTGRPQPPRPLDGEALAFDDAGDRRRHLADWLVARENPYFSRAVANRVWANFMGVGLVESVDDLRVTNPPSNGELLDALGRFLADHQFDLRELMRAILHSAAYQRSSRPLAGNRTDSRFYSRYYPRRLKAEVLLDAFSQVTGVPTKFPGYPAGWRAMQLPDSNVESYFLQSFGRPARERTCECERTAEPSIAQVLHVANGDTLNSKLAAPENLISAALSVERSAADIVEDLYLTALARYPTAEEKTRLTEVVDAARDGEARLVLEDLYWSVLSSKEFLFNR